MKRHSLFPFLLLVLGLSVSAYEAHGQSNLRHSVAIVYEQPDSVLSSRLKDYSLWLSRQGKRDASRYLTSLTRKGTGSGVVVEHAGQLLLLTNSHVIGTGSYADVAFIQGRDTLLIPHCRRIMQDHLMDLAVLRLPQDGDGRLIPLSFSELPVEDGMSVWSAGFPGLAGFPSWQIGQGIVSNSDLTFPDWDKHFIQHTAQIDPGSSGGPLLLRSEESYHIIGINTSKAYAREGVGLAIPASDCLAALRAPEGSTVRALLIAIDTLDVTDYASLYMRMPEDIIRRQDSLFERGEYLEALALIPAYADTAQLSKKNATHMIRREKGGKARYSGLSTRQQNKLRNAERGILEDFEYRCQIGIKASLWGPMPDVWSAELFYHHYLGSYVRMGGSFGVTQLAPQWYYSDWDRQFNNIRPIGPTFRYFVGGQLPISLGKVVVIPYLTPDVGLMLNMGGGDPAPVLVFGGAAGAELGIHAGSSLFLIGVDYDLQGANVFTHMSYAKSDIEKLRLMHGLGFHIGFAF